MKDIEHSNHEKLQQIFQDEDTDKDGKIGIKSLKETLVKLGYKVEEQELEEVLKNSGIDTTTESAEINFGMFSSLIKKISSEKDQEKQLRLAFDVFDGDKKGYIEGPGIKRVLTRLKIEHTNEDVDLMMEVADINGDGRVDIEEFLQIFKSSDSDGHANNHSRF